MKKRGRGKGKEMLRRKGEEGKAGKRMKRRVNVRELDMVVRAMEGKKRRIAKRK